MAVRLSSWQTAVIGGTIGLLGGALFLVMLPRADLPCEVTITYASRVHKNGKHRIFQGRVVETVKQQSLRGTGGFRGNGLACEVNLLRAEGT